MTENKIQISFEELSSKIEDLSTLDQKLVTMSEKANKAMNSLMVLKFTSKYQNLNSTSYLKNMPAFFHLDENLNLKKNSEREFKAGSENLNKDKDGIDDETMEAIIDKVDSELNPPKFDDIDEFIKFNKIRSELIKERVEEWKKDGGKKLDKRDRLEGEDKGDIPDAGRRFNVVTVTNPKIKKIQNLFKDYLKSCLDIAKEARSRHKKN